MRGLLFGSVDRGLGATPETHVFDMRLEDPDLRNPLLPLCRQHK